MKAKLIKESISKGSNFFIDEIETIFETDPQYKPYARFRGLINGTILQLASELSNETNDVSVNLVDRDSYELEKENTKEYMNDHTSQYHLVCTTSYNVATLMFKYDEMYSRKLYGIKRINPIYIVISLNPEGR